MKTPKLNIAIADVLKQFGIETIASEKLANLLLDYRAFEEYPSTKPILRDILKKGYGTKLFNLYQADPASMTATTVALTEEYLGDTEFKKDQVQYVFDCLLFGLGVVKQVNEPFSNSFDPYAAKGDILDTLEEQFNQLRKQYVDLLDKLATRPNDILHDAAGYYTAAALTQLYAVEAKINVLCQQLNQEEKTWCKKQRETKLAAFQKAKVKAVQAEITKEKTTYTGHLNSSLILPRKYGIKSSGYLDAATQTERDAIATNIKDYYGELNLPYDNWCEDQEKELLAKHHVGWDSIAKQVGLIYVLPFVILLITAITSIRYAISADNIAQYDRYMFVGDSLSTEKDYIGAMCAYYTADTIYHAKFRSSGYHRNAQTKLKVATAKFGKHCDSLLEQKKLSQVKSLVEAIPQPIRDAYPHIDTNARRQLSESIDRGLDDMISRISKNGGKLKQEDKEYLNELMLVSEDKYWFNIIKKKSK